MFFGQLDSFYTVRICQWLSSLSELCLGSSYQFDHFPILEPICRLACNSTAFARWQHM